MKSGSGCEPGGEGVAGARRGDVAGGDRPDHGAHEERGDDRGEGEGRARGAALVQPFDRLAEGEARAAQDDPQHRQHQRHVEGGEDRAEGLGEGGPEDDEDEDQPDVVGLPDGGQRALDRHPRPFALLGVAGEEVPEAAAEVGAAEDRVEARPGPEDHCRGGAHTCASGEYGDASFSAVPSPPSRQRRDIRRRTTIAIVPDRRVEQQGEDEGAPDAVRVGHRFRGFHVAVDDPRLAPHLGHYPARPERQRSRRSRRPPPLSGTTGSVGCRASCTSRRRARGRAAGAPSRSRPSGRRQDGGRCCPAAVRRWGCRSAR